MQEITATQVDDKVMTKTPKVSVVMGVYNGEKHLAEAIESILQQTFSDFEFIIVNDGSTDQTADILDNYASQDNRIIVISNKKNGGVAASINSGQEVARGEYIARMDGDDISLPQRFERQVNFMDANPHIGISGTFIKLFGQVEHYPQAPLTDADIKCSLFLRATMSHSSVIIRKQVLQVHNIQYDEQYWVTQDYKFWVDAAPYTLFANIPEILLYYRVHNTQISSRKNQEQYANEKKIKLIQLKNLGMEPTNDEIDLHLRLTRYEGPFTQEFISRAEQWIRKIQAQNKKVGIYPEPEFSTLLNDQWLKLCRGNTQMGMFAWNIYNKSTLSHSIRLNWKKQLKFHMLCQFAEIRKQVSTD